MLEQEFDIASLIAARLSRTLTETEQLQLDNWLNENQGNKELYKQLLDENTVRLKLIKFNKANKDTVWDKTRLGLMQAGHLEMKHEKRQGIRLWPRIAVTAAAVAVITIGTIFFTNPNVILNLFQDTESAQYADDIAPGTTGATLTLASGKQIKLTDAANGKLAQEAGVSITKTKDGQLFYEIQDQGEGSNKTNTLSTANGETYQLRLPDGTLVYLNAASSISYAASLIERGKRVVKLSGEAYLEVAKDKAHPFIVKTDKQEVEVLGTQFNVNAYPDEGSTKTTLVEGSVSLSSPDQRIGTHHAIVLKSNQQAINTGKGIILKQIDPSEAIAWKNGEFVFADEDLKSIMRKVARWYDVEVIYEKGFENRDLVGTISKFENVSKVLKMLEMTGTVHFKVEGRRITVMK